MAENPSYNSSHPKWRGTELADLDCGYGIKAVAARSPFKTGSFIAATGRVLGVGECVSLIRVRAGTQILGGELYWERTAAGTCVPTTVLAVGDPYCCARLIGPVNTLYQKGIMLAALQQQWAFDCSKIQKHGTTGDGCGVGYTYTCDTDIVLTNLYNDGNAYSQEGAAAYPSFQTAAVATWLSELTGLGLSHAVDTDHDITIAVGAAASYHATITSRVLLNLTAALTKQIDAAWAVGTNQGGLFSGAVGTSTWYHVFLIRRSDTGVVDAGFDTSVTAANIPASYDQYRRIGSVRTDGSANILAFVQDGDLFQWSAPPLDINVSNPGTAAVTRTLSVPTGVSVLALVNALAYDDTSAGGTPVVYLSDLAVTDEAASVSAGPLGQTAGGGTTVSPNPGQILVRADTSAQIRSRISASGATHRLRIATTGWIDSRGKNA